MLTKRSFSLAGHRAPHLLWEIDSLYFNQSDLDAPRAGVRIENLLQTRVQLLARGKQFIELGLSKH